MLGLRVLSRMPCLVTLAATASMTACKPTPQADTRVKSDQSTPATQFDDTTLKGQAPCRLTASSDRLVATRPASSPARVVPPSLILIRTILTTRIRNNPLAAARVQRLAAARGFHVREAAAQHK